MRYVIMTVAALLATANWLDSQSGQRFKRELFRPHPSELNSNW